MATTAIHRLTLDPMGKCSNAFFSETRNMIGIKNKIFVEDLPMIIPEQFVSTVLVVSEKKRFETFSP
jgi:hypothetical protein